MRILKQEEMSQVSGGFFFLSKLFSWSWCKPAHVAPVCAPKPAPVCAPKPAPVCAPCAPKKSC